MRRNVLRFAGLVSLLVATFVTRGASAQTPARAETGQHPGRFATTVQKQVSADYLLFLPSDYRNSGPKKWPLIVFLHGAGERGTNVDLVLRHGPPKRVLDDPAFPFAVLSPQCPPGTTWNLETLDALLDDVLARHPSLDTTRVYLTGLSMGGYGSWAWAAARPERFAAVVPICGGGDPIAVRLAGGDRRETLSKLPIWCFHGGKDTVVQPAESQRMVDAYRMIGNEVRLTLYPEAGHDSWTETYANPDLYTWFLSHQRR